MSLATILEEIKKLKPLSEEDVDQGPMSTMSGRRARKRQAIESLKDFKESYIEELTRSAVFILVTGTNRDAFTSTSAEQFGCLAANPDDFYVDLANRVSPILYQNKESVSSLFDVVGRYLEDKAQEMHVIGYPQLLFKQEYQGTIKNKEDFVKLIKRAINGQVGGELAGLHAVRSLADTAIANGHSAKVTPIILNTSDEMLVAELVPALERLTRSVFVVVCGKASKAVKSIEGTLIVKDGTKELVEQTLTLIRNSVKK